MIRNANTICVVPTTRGLISETGQPLDVDLLIAHPPEAVYTVAAVESLPFYERCYEIGLPVYVCSPQLVQRKSVTSIVMLLKNLRISSMIGGFRRLTQDDMHLLRLRLWLETVTLNGAPCWETPISCLVTPIKRMPVLQRMRYVSSLNEDQLAKVLAYAIDPRWFSYPEISPERFQRYFKIGPHRPAVIKPLDERYHAASSAWYSASQAELLKSLKGYVRNLSPRDYFMREWYKNYLLHDTGKAITKVTKKFLTFLYYVWMDTVCEVPEGIFVPERFFGDNKQDLEAWQQWNSELLLKSEDRGCS
jgi:hypothetical protein